MPRNDVAIYAPDSAGAYERGVHRVGGAERQMSLLARTLSDRGHSVAHIVFPVADPVVPNPRLRLVQRSAGAASRGIWRNVTETVQVWRSLRAADAASVVVRTASPVVGIAAVYCVLHRRRLIFSSANDSDLTIGEVFGARWHRRALYTMGLRLSHALVVQSKQQETLAERTFPKLRAIVHVPSFAETAISTDGTRSASEGFLWISRVVEYKQPLKYLELAEALPDVDFSMVAVPDPAGDDRFLELVRERARSLPNLELLEPAPHRVIQSRIARAVALVNTSRFEGMPNVFLEAWALGVPVLTLGFDPDGVVTRHGLGVAAQGSWQRFVEAAATMWRHRADRAERFAGTRDYVARFHSVDAVGARWAHLLGLEEPLSSPAASL
jgi:glycosyltransferase involved in cell wall biosynthesis